MNCTNCGSVIRKGQKFCGKCGTMVPGEHIEQKDTFYVRKLPMVMIVLLTLGLIITSFTMESGSMTVAMGISFIQAIILIFFIYRLDRIEPEPVSLLLKLFLWGALAVPIVATIIENIIEAGVSVIADQGTIMFNILDAFLVAAFTEEICKYAVLKKFTWKHPAFNFRFDGVVYSTTVAIGFEVVENLLYLFDSDASTAYLRSAFPGHCIFGIYMGYYYGQAKSLELMGDARGSAKMRRKGVLTAIMIHGIYDSVAMICSDSSNELLMYSCLLALVVIMCVLNVNAYKNIKKFAHEDKPV
ncbi:PrsW family glutamic-type intramembrane protease [Butyrivibrio sp. WCE2006]|uniref:PrsW family glutamic-type intramembrane protease n=1 Tax=Butyrivibrio sp. WCE2006 TaxID=1410611 RepID=UPI0005D2CBFB|nr:PrsW family glutamic-type intramembrane protease [Butyrivibrio sp. WCE2006]